MRSQLIIELLKNENNLPLNPNSVLYGDLYLRKLYAIYERTINLSDGIIEESNKDKQELAKYFSQYPFVEDHKWLIAKDKLRSFLTMMLDIIQSGGLDQSVFWSHIHKDIIDVSKNKFEDRHYADAVESALKSVNKRVKNIVKAKTAKEMDGKGLMLEAFSPKCPVIVLDDPTNRIGMDIQEGYMHIFAGAMQGIRNPKAHDNVIITRERAIHHIFLASLLMHILDEGKS